MAVNAFDAVNAVIAAKWPTRMVYPNILPRDFERPSFFLQQKSGTSKPHTRFTVEWTVELMLDCFITVDDYSIQKDLELMQLQAEVLALFVGGSIPAGDRHLTVSAVSAGSNPGEAYVDIVVTYADDIPVTPVEHQNMQEININYRG